MYIELDYLLKTVPKRYDVYCHTVTEVIMLPACSDLYVVKYITLPTYTAQV